MVFIRKHQCDELLMELPATDEDGKTVSDPIDAGSKQVYLKEIQAPENYLLDSNVLSCRCRKGGGCADDSI